jgi:hypothetical protein
MVYRLVQDEGVGSELDGTALWHQVHKGKLGMSSRDFVHVWHRCTVGNA